jgi:hypothetical protein
MYLITVSLATFAAKFRFVAAPFVTLSVQRIKNSRRLIQYFSDTRGSVSDFTRIEQYFPPRALMLRHEKIGESAEISGVCAGTYAGLRLDEN